MGFWGTAPHAPPEQGPALLRLVHLGQVYAAWIRVFAYVPVVVVAGLASTRVTATSTAVVLTSVSAATALYLYGMFRELPDWVAFVDAGSLVVLALSTPLTIPTEWLAGGKSWLVPLITTACVGYQYHLRPLVSGAFAIVIHGALAVGLLVALPPGAPPFGIITVCWSLIIAVLARMLWSLVQRGGRIADSAMAEAEWARTEQQVASAVRADEQALTNALHDTAATTLLMVGLGEVRSTDDTLCRGRT